MELISARLIIKILEQKNFHDDEIDCFFSHFYSVFIDEFNFEKFSELYVEYLLVNKKFDEFKILFDYHFEGLDEYIHDASVYLFSKYSYENDYVREFTPLDRFRLEYLDHNFEEDEVFNFLYYSGTTEKILLLKQKNYFNAFHHICKNSPKSEIYNDVFISVFWKICDDSRKYFLGG